MIEGRKYWIFCLCILNWTVWPAFSNAQSAAVNTQVSTGYGFLRMNEVNARAARHFANHFVSDGRENWTIIDGFYMASFTKDAVKTVVFYHPRGGFAYSIKYYTANLLNDNIKTAILKKYQDHIIDVVTEISSFNGQIYYIKIKNSTNIKMIRFARNFMEVTEDFENAGN